MVNYLRGIVFIVGFGSIRFTVRTFKKSMTTRGKRRWKKRGMWGRRGRGGRLVQNEGVVVSESQTESRSVTGPTIPGGVAVSHGLGTDRTHCCQCAAALTLATQIKRFMMNRRLPNRARRIRSVVR